MKNAYRILRTLFLVVMVAVMSTMAVFASDGEHISNVYMTAWSLLPPVVAIVLALLTKEVYSSLFVGILAGGILYSNFDFELTISHVFVDGIVGSLADGYNVGILVFLVLLGSLVSMMNKAGGSAAFGRWASVNIKTRVGAQLACILLGCLIFIDDYFNCLTVGSVMRPVADQHKISRAKLAYLIDATAAPVVIIAPISSWAAAVAGFVPDGQGLALFISAIPYNFYALLTILTMVMLVVTRTDFGPMAKFEQVAVETGDLFNGKNPYANQASEEVNEKGGIADLVVPVIVLIIASTIGMIYSGGFFDGESFIDAFSNCDASVGLMYGAAFGFAFTVVFYMIRKTLGFRASMECLPDGFKAMVPAIMILTFAWTLKSMTDSLGAASYVEMLVQNSAGALHSFLPAIIFVIACLLAFATGTSWGTFGILIPITMDIFPLDNPLGIICVSACLAGAVCGDHCSPISDTTIMSSAGAQCDHISHVSTQIPYAITVAAVTFVSYIIAGFVQNVFICLPIAAVLMVATLIVISKKTQKVA